MKKLLILLLLLPALVWADAGLRPGANLGIAATNINSIVAFIYNVLDVILYIGAAIMGMSGLLKYRLHRRNPQQVPLSTPVTELSLSGVFILLGLLTQLSTSYQAVDNPNLPNASTVTPPPSSIQVTPTPNQYPY